MLEVTEGFSPLACLYIRTTEAAHIPHFNTYWSAIINVRLSLLPSLKFPSSLPSSKIISKFENLENHEGFLKILAFHYQVNVVERVKIKCKGCLLYQFSL